MRYEEKMMQPFYKIGKWIASKMVKKEDVKYQKLEQTLQFVENSAKEKDAFEFTARRIAKVMMILFWGTGLCFLAAVFTGEAKEITFLARPSYGQGSMETDLEVQVEGEGEAQKIPILLQERQYSDQQIDEFFQQAIEGKRDSRGKYIDAGSKKFPGISFFCFRWQSESRLVYR